MNLIFERADEPMLLQLLTDAQSAMARLFESRARHLGLTRPQWRIVAGLYGHSGITQTELSELTSIARSPLGKIVDQLENKGFLERHRDPDDRRINRLVLTEAVRPLLAPAAQLATELEREVLEGLPGSGGPREMLVLLVERLQELVSNELLHSGVDLEPREA